MPQNINRMKHIEIEMLTDTENCPVVALPGLSGATAARGIGQAWLGRRGDRAVPQRRPRENKDRQTAAGANNDELGLDCRTPEDGSSRLRGNCVSVAK
jgi:hypothetical protein